MGEGIMTWISSGVTQSLSTGYSWGSYFLGEGSTLGSMLGTANSGAAIAASLWSVVGGVRMVQTGWKEGSKTKMAVGTVMCLLAATELVPETWKTAMSDYLGGFSALLPAVPMAMLTLSKAYEKQIGYLVTGAPIAFGAGLKKLVGEGVTLGDEGVTGLYAFLTAVGNAYKEDPTNWSKNITAAMPAFEKSIPYWAMIRDRKDIIDFVTTNAASVPGYVANVSNFALHIAKIPFGQPCGTQVVITAPKTTKTKRRRRRHK